MREGVSPKDAMEQAFQELHDLQRGVDSRTSTRHAKGGLVGINDIIKPINMASGGDANRAELEGLLKSLTISLMLAKETGSFLGGSSSQKIKKLENQIRQIKLMLGE